MKACRGGCPQVSTKTGRAKHFVQNLPRMYSFWSHVLYNTSSAVWKCMVVILIVLHRILCRKSSFCKQKSGKLIKNQTNSTISGNSIQLFITGFVFSMKHAF